MKRANLMIGCFRKSDANDPETYFIAVVAVLVRWPPEVIVAVTEPATGMPSRINWLPSIAEITEACETAYAPIARAKARDVPMLPAPQRPKLSEAELDAQFRRLGLAHLRPGSKCDTRAQRFPDNEALEAQAILDRYAAEAAQTNAGTPE